jgi:hypothetical protein
MIKVKEASPTSLPFSLLARNVDGKIDQKQIFFIKGLTRKCESGTIRRDGQKSYNYAHLTVGK